MCFLVLACLLACLLVCLFVRVCAPVSVCQYSSLSISLSPLRLFVCLLDCLRVCLFACLCLFVSVLAYLLLVSIIRNKGCIVHFWGSTGRGGGWSVITAFPFLHFCHMHDMTAGFNWHASALFITFWPLFSSPLDLVNSCSHGSACVTGWRRPT